MDIIEYLKAYDQHALIDRINALEISLNRKLEIIMATNAENKAALVELQTLVTDVADDVTKMDAKITELMKNPGDQATVDEIATIVADMKQRLSTAAGVFPKQEG